MMGFPMFGKYGPTIGLDLEADSVKAVELRMEDGKLSPVRFFISNAWDGNTHEKKDFESELLKGFKKAAFESKKTIATLPRGNVYLRKSFFPKMPDNEIESIVLSQARGWDHIPHITSGDPLIDYAVLSSSEKSYEIAVAIAERREVSQYFSRVKSLRLKPLAIEAVPFALARFSKRFFKSNSKIALVDISAEVVTFVYTDGGRLRFTRQFPTGEPEISNFLRVRPWESSENGQYIERLVSSLAEQIKRTIDFCLAELRERSVDGIVLVGDGATSQELSSGLKDMLGPEVKPLYRIKGLQFDTSGSYTGFSLEKNWEEKVIPRMVVAIGAAFRGVESEG